MYNVNYDYNNLIYYILSKNSKLTLPVTNAMTSVKCNLT